MIEQFITYFESEINSTEEIIKEIEKYGILKSQIIYELKNKYIECQNKKQNKLVTTKPVPNDCSCYKKQRLSRLSNFERKYVFEE